MLRRVPPPLLALAATVVLLGVVVGLFVALGGGGSDRPVGTCTDALARGPYGCVVFVSVSGSEAGRDAEEPVGGGITYRITEQGDDRLALVVSTACGTATAPVAVTASRYRVGDLSMPARTCTGADAGRLEWAEALLAGTVRVSDRDDSTVELVRGDRRAVFVQVVAPRG